MLKKAMLLHSLVDLYGRLNLLTLLYPFIFSSLVFFLASLIAAVEWTRDVSIAVVFWRILCATVFVWLFSLLSNLSFLHSRFKLELGRLQKEKTAGIRNRMRPQKQILKVNLVLNTIFQLIWIFHASFLPMYIEIGLAHVINASCAVIAFSSLLISPRNSRRYLTQLTLGLYPIFFSKSGNSHVKSSGEAAVARNGKIDFVRIDDAPVPAGLPHKQLMHILKAETEMTKIERLISEVETARASQLSRYVGKQPTTREADEGET